MCEPSARPESDAGLVQTDHEPESSRHSNVAVPSSDVKLNDAAEEFDALGGVDKKLVSGATVSTVQVYDAGEPSMLPAASVARTAKVCEPSAMPLKLWGDVQDAHGPVSNRHSYVTGLSSDVNANDADVEFEAKGGFDVMVVLGAVASTLHVYGAGVGSVLVAASVARTWNVWVASLRPL